MYVCVFMSVPMRKYIYIYKYIYACIYNNYKINLFCIRM